MSDAQQANLDRVAEYLGVFCVGREYALTKHEIARDLDIEERELHDVLGELVESKRLPICSTCAPPMGYFLATDPADKRAAVHSLARRAISIFRRRRALKTAPLWPRKPFKQQRLFA